MKKGILPSAISLVILHIATSGFALDHDLIVTTKGDPIACHIDGITATNIYYMMKSHGAWIHTYIPSSDVSEYKAEIIDRNKYQFKPGTTVIESINPESPVAPNLIFSTEDTFVFLALSLGYSF